MSKAKLRVCASCEWIFRSEGDCPKCGFGSYGAHYVYGPKAYMYAKSQEPWMKRKLERYISELRQEIRVSHSDQAQHDRVEAVDILSPTIGASKRMAELLDRIEGGQDDT